MWAWCCLTQLAPPVLLPQSPEEVVSASTILGLAAMSLRPLPSERVVVFPAAKQSEVGLFAHTKALRSGEAQHGLMAWFFANKCLYAGG